MLCRFELARGGDGTVDVVRLIIGEEPPVEERFDAGVFKERRVAAILHDLESGVCGMPQVHEIGSHLWNVLQPGRIRKRFEQLPVDDRLMIAIEVVGDIAAGDLPFEALYDDTTSRCFLATEERFCISRVVHPSPTYGINRPKAEGVVGILVVLPTGARLDVAREYAGLQRAAGNQRDRVRMERLDGFVTVDRLYEALHGQQQWDIVHFIGHSRLDPEAGVQIRINSEETADKEVWLDAARFSRLFAGTSVRLAVFNSCESASAATLVASLGQEVASKGVPAVVAMRYSIDDVSSARFSDAFYRALLSLPNAGNVSVAVQRARNALYMNAADDALRSFITPILYVVPGEEQVFTEDRLVSDRAEERVNVFPRRLQARPAHFDELLMSIQKQRCVPVVGPEVHEAALRDAIPVLHDEPTFLRMLEGIARDCDYDEVDELRIAETSGTFRVMVLSRVFQHYADSRDPIELIDRLVDFFSSVRHSQPLEQVAKWPVPGVIYTHFDGFMEAALDAASVEYRVINAPQDGLAATSDVGNRPKPPLLLVNMRGSVRAPQTLVLTDHEHDRLIDNNLPRSSKEVVTLFNGALGRSVAFIGVPPNDPVARRLARLFLTTQSSDPTSAVVPQGPRFFVTARVAAADRAYWNQFKIKWIEEDPVTVIRLLSEALA